MQMPARGAPPAVLFAATNLSQRAKGWVCPGHPQKMHTTADVRFQRPDMRKLKHSDVGALILLPSNKMVLGSDKEQNTDLRGVAPARGRASRQLSACGGTRTVEQGDRFQRETS